MPFVAACGQNYAVQCDVIGAAVIVQAEPQGGEATLLQAELESKRPARIDCVNEVEPCPQWYVGYNEPGDYHLYGFVAAPGSQGSIVEADVHVPRGECGAIVQQLTLSPSEGFALP